MRPSSSTQVNCSYRLDSVPKGLVYVFNYRFLGHKTDERKGAECDSINIKEVFPCYDYEVTLFEDLTKEQSKNTLARIQRDKKLEEVDSLIVFILSHGIGPYIFKCNDGEQMDLNDITEQFNNVNCPQLIGKPKIFLVNYCRGLKEEILKFDGDDNNPDMITIFASVPEYRALRSQDKGTIFVLSLCKILQEREEPIEIDVLFEALKYEMKYGLNKGSTPCKTTTLKKQFFFRRKQ